MRMRWSLAAGLLVLLAVGCSSKKETMPDAPTPGKPAGTATEAKSIKVGLVLDVGGVDDESFNSAAWGGLQKAEKEGGVVAKKLESKQPTDYVNNLTSLAQDGNTLVFAIGFMMEDALKEVAPKFPNTKFAIIDGSAPDLPNCVSIKFREEEGSFLAGYLAAKMSKTGAVGFVGGVDSDLINKFRVGYTAGAMTGRGDIRVVSKFVGDFTDVGKAKEIARQSVEKDGVDIIFAAAGKGGLGVLDAMAEKGTGYYGIGVDMDQDAKNKGRVLTSMMKGVDTGVYDTVKQVKDGKFQPGEQVFGLKEKGVHLSEMKYTKQDVPAEVLAKLEELSKMIVEGKIKVPTTAAELQSFTAPKL